MSEAQVFTLTVVVVAGMGALLRSCGAVQWRRARVERLRQRYAREAEQRLRRMRALKRSPGQG